DRRAGEQHLADRIARHQPFRDRARGREHYGRAEHVENAERNVLPAHRNDWRAEIRAARFAYAVSCRLVDCQSGIRLLVAALVVAFSAEHRSPLFRKMLITCSYCTAMIRST